MKKIYALMALATTLTASAAVAPSVKKIESARNENTVAEIGEYTFVEHNNDMFKAPATGDVNNYYSFSYYGQTKQDSQQQHYVIQIKKVSATELEIYGLVAPLADWPVKATYNASAQTITIAPQVVVPAAEWDGVNDFKLWTMQFDVTSDNKITNEREISSITFTYCPDGVQLNNGSIGYVGAWLPESSYQKFMFNTQKNVDEADAEGMSGWLGSWKYGLAFSALEDMYPDAPAFTFNDNEWASIGTSKFTDGWLKVLTTNGAGFPAYDVDTYVNKANDNLYLLRNPYGAKSPYASVNADINNEGYIILDITNPDCVLVRPNVSAGFVAEEYTGIASNFACATTEGNKIYLEGWTYEDVMDEADTYGDDLPTMSQGRVITLPNCRIQVIPGEFENPYQWQTKDEELIPMEAQIVLANPAGVEGVINDADNAAKRYFNLQGLEIANPAAGELVIVKQGNKTTKVIVK